MDLSFFDSNNLDPDIDQVSLALSSSCKTIEPPLGPKYIFVKYQILQRIMGPLTILLSTEIMIAIIN